MSAEAIARAGLTDVLALTMRNPWAHLIARGVKTVENRTWMPPESLWRFLVHAGKAWAGAGEWRPLAGDVDGVTASAIVAVADVAHVCSGRRWIASVPCACGPWAQPLHMHWNLTNVRALPEPVPCSGRQGLWRPDFSVLSAVAVALRSDAGGEAAREAPSKDPSVDLEGPV